MRKDEVSAVLRRYVKEHLSPTGKQREYISSLYAAFQSALDDRTLLTGSYARYTAIRPLHDLDILFIGGRFDAASVNPKQILDEVEKAIRQRFRSPQDHPYKIGQQSHSVTVTFNEGREEEFSVDVVPGFTSGDKNEFGKDVYWVPEILKHTGGKRRRAYEISERAMRTENEWWVRSDPRGYIDAATELNAINSDFRKAVKFVKRWKANCEQEFGEFKLKSFHVEQSIYRTFRSNHKSEIADAVFQFFCEIPDLISRPQIPDRADSGKFVDDYVADLTEADKQLIMRARDGFLIELEDISPSTNVMNLVEARTRERMSSTEAYLFDSRIPVYTEPDKLFAVRGRALERKGGFRAFILDAVGKIPVDRKIEFRISKDETGASLFKWKVKNDDNSPEPRGEISDHRTRNDPENSKYRGKHYVECFAIRDGVCVARDRQEVVLGP